MKVGFCTPIGCFEGAVSPLAEFFRDRSDRSARPSISICIGDNKGRDCASPRRESRAQKGDVSTRAARRGMYSLATISSSRVDREMFETR